MSGSAGRSGESARPGRVGPGCSRAWSRYCRAWSA